MNEKEKEEFLQTINSLPHWVKTFDDLKKFTKHMIMSHLQAKQQLDIVFKFLKEKDCKIHDECCEILLEKGHLIKELYDNTYNFDVNLIESIKSSESMPA